MNAVGPTSKELVAVIRNRLSEAGITQREAAVKTGISLSTLSRRLTGQSPFFIYELVPIAAILGVELSSLFETAEVTA